MAAATKTVALRQVPRPIVVRNLSLRHVNVPADQRSGQVSPSPRLCAEVMHQLKRCVSGCLSCKRRHVKCDERKPGCSRCEAAGSACEGYGLPRTTERIPRGERRLLPRTQPTPSAATRGTALTTDCARLPLLVVPKTGLGLSGDEYWYYALYRNKVAQDLSPCHNGNFWSRSPLRDSMTRRSIKHSILGIGAYARALMDLATEHPTLYAADRPWWPVTVFNKHREAALKHHAQALACMRREILLDDPECRAMMAATLLFIVFENMMGNYHSSRNLIRSGIKLLNNMGQSMFREFVWKTHCNSFETPNEIDEMAHIFSRHSITSAFLPFPSKDSTHQTLFGHDGEGAMCRNGDTICVYAGTQANTPRTLEHARAIWEVIYTTVAQFYAKAAWRNLDSNYPHDDVLFAEQASLATRLRDFGTGLAVLSRGGPDKQRLRRFAFLEIHHLVASIVVSCALDRTETSYDSHAAQFAEILTGAVKLVGDSPLPNRSTFTNEVGWLPVIAFIALKCRIPKTRLGALQFLRNSAWREGPWDGVSLAHAVSNLMQLEGQTDQDRCLYGRAPPSERRYVWTNMLWDIDNRRMTMEYTRALSDHDGTPEKAIRVVDG